MKLNRPSTRTIRSRRSDWRLQIDVGPQAAPAVALVVSLLSQARRPPHNGRVGGGIRPRQDSRQYLGGKQWAVWPLDDGCCRRGLTAFVSRKAYKAFRMR